jgi:hypothetical protein
VVSHGGREVAVEVDGPLLFQAVQLKQGGHYYKPTPNGAAALKKRQLRAAGWPLLSIPFWAWRELKTLVYPRDLARAKEEYLMRELEGLEAWLNGGKRD